MASKWKEPPRDALDTLVHGAADLASLRDVQQVRCFCACFCFV
jgi:hypothetical protein